VIVKAIEKEQENKGLFPNEPGIALRLGLLFYKDEQFENAKNEFQYALTLDKKFANAMYFLGLTFDKQGDKDAAIAQFEEVSELNPDNEDVKTILENLRSGRGALIGLEQDEQEAPVAEQSRGESEEQPRINPDVESQEIPEEATPAIEDIGGEEEVNPEQQPQEGPASERQP